MRKIAWYLSILGGLATTIAALLVATQATDSRMGTLALGGEILLGLAGTAAVALAARTPTLAALLQLGIGFTVFGIAPDISSGIAWLPATALFTTSAIFLFCSVPRSGWSLFGVARGVGTLLAAFYLVMGVSEGLSGLGPSGHPLKDFITLSPTYGLIIGPLLGWLGRRWAAVGGGLLLGEYVYFIGLALWSGDPGGAGGWAGALLFLALWALIGVAYLWEWWRHRPHGESHPGAGMTRATAD